MTEAAWQRFGDAAKEVGADRAALLRAFMDWFTHQPGAKLPRRP